MIERTLFCHWFQACHFQKAFWPVQRQSWSVCSVCMHTSTINTSKKWCSLVRKPISTLPSNISSTLYRSSIWLNGKNLLLCRIWSINLRAKIDRTSSKVDRRVILICFWSMFLNFTYIWWHKIFFCSICGKRDNTQQLTQSIVFFCLIIFLFEMW